MRLRRDGFPARTLVTALATAWATAIGLMAASGHESSAQTVGTVVSSAAPADTHTTAAAPAPPSAQPATGFVGDETCATCHEPEGKGLHATLHGKSRN